MTETLGILDDEEQRFTAAAYRYCAHLAAQGIFGEAELRIGDDWAVTVKVGETDDDTIPPGEQKRQDG